VLCNFNLLQIFVKLFPEKFGKAGSRAHDDTKHNNTDCPVLTGHSSLIGKQRKIAIYGLTSFYVVSLVVICAVRRPWRPPAITRVWL